MVNHRTPGLGAPVALQLRQSVGMKLEQKLKLTPQMIQSIEILLLPQMALEERLMNEIESNPALDIIDEADGPSPIESASERSEADSFAEAQTTEWDQDRYSESLKSRSREPYDEDAPDRMKAIEATPGPAPTLGDYLLDQLRFMDVPEELWSPLETLCWHLDHRGWLAGPLTEVFEAEDMAEAEMALEYVRRCEPAGIGARDLQDCLLLQLEREKGDNEFEMQVVRDHLDDLLHNRLPALSSQMGVPVERLQDALEVVGHLDPHPGSMYTRSDNHIVIPDVIVERTESGGWEVSIPDSHLPTVTVNEDYQSIVQDPSVAERDRVYLKEQLSSARFLLDAIAQRKRTLLKIATEIVHRQQDFLSLGPEYLKPLMRQDIADVIGMHVATVSRAVKDKYIQTPSGTVPLANFFSGGIASQDGGEAESSRAVKLKIKKLIENEDSRKPLSDQAIADALAKDGLDISRRTVTKYRIAENIPSTRQRRKFS